jgi:hypothetical protein
VSNTIDGLSIINGNNNVTNTLSGTAFYAHIIETCQQIYDLLSDHCGPHATDAMIIADTDGRNLKDPHYAIFTKDGINIVRSIQFASPIQRNIQNLVTYIGTRVDSLSHDGTTTAMMFFNALVVAHFKRISTILENNQLPNYRKLRYEVGQIMGMFKKNFEHSVVTVEDLAKDMGWTPLEALRFVAFHQAMLSSKKDREMADAIVEVVETLPKELYGLFTTSQSKIETDQRFTVVRDDFDFVMPGNCNLDDMNHNMGTEYFSETCDLIVSEDDLMKGNPALKLIENLISDAVTEGRDKDLVIVTKSLDSIMTGVITQYNRAHHQKIIVINFSSHSSYSSKITLLSAVQAVAGVYPMREHVIDSSLPYIIHNAKVHYKYHRLFMSNLYQKDGSAYHPFHTNRDAFLPYTIMVDDIKAALDEHSSGRKVVETAADEAKFIDFVEIYRRMISAYVCNLQISGMRHDTLADRDVVQDAFGAVLSSLEHGFVFDGYLKLYLEYHACDRGSPVEPFVETIYGILEAVHKWDAHGNNPRNKFCETMSAAVALYTKNKDGCKYDYYPIDGEISTLSEVYTLEGETPVIQPADSYRELFRRVEDLLPKLIGASRAIIPNVFNAGAAA